MPGSSFLTTGRSVLAEQGCDVVIGRGEKPQDVSGTPGVAIGEEHGLLQGQQGDGFVQHLSRGDAILQVLLKSGLQLFNCPQTLALQPLKFTPVTKMIKILVSYIYYNHRTQNNPV